MYDVISRVVMFIVIALGGMYMLRLGVGNIESVGTLSQSRLQQEQATITQVEAGQVAIQGDESNQHVVIPAETTVMNENKFVPLAQLGEGEKVEIVKDGAGRVVQVVPQTTVLADTAFSTGAFGGLAIVLIMAAFVTGGAIVLGIALIKRVNNTERTDAMITPSS